MGRRPHTFLVWALVVVSATLYGCSKEETITQPVATTPPKFLLSPDTLVIVDSSPTANVYLSTDAPGTLNWRVTSKPAWVSIDPDSGQVSQSLSQAVVTASPIGLSPGTYGGTITFHSSGGIKTVYLLFSVAEHPNGVVSVTSLHFGPGETEEMFTLTNEGTGLLMWSVSSSQAWLSVGPPGGYLTPGQSQILYATATRSGLPVGTASALVTVTSNSEGGPIEVSVTMDVAASPQLETSPDSLRFDFFVNLQSFKVWNSGNAPLTWNAAASESYVQLGTTTRTLDPGDTSTVEVTVDRTGMSSGTYQSGISITAAGLPPRSVGVSVKHFNESKWLLDDTITDAEYDRVHNRIVAVGGSASPRLLVLDPDGRTTQIVALPLPSSCVSVQPDGLYAAAGHDGSVSYVNLSTMTVQQTYGVTADALDVVLPGNGWVYVFPRRDQWTTIRCIDLGTGSETPHTGFSIYAGTLGRLHPSGSYLYTADNGLSPSDFQKFDIRSGTAAYMYDSPYHGDYSFAGNLWFSEDGLRIFARSGNVFRASTNQPDDMTYTGNLTGAGVVQWVESSTLLGRVLCLTADGFFGPAPPELRVYNTSFLAFLGVVRLPPFLVPNGSGGGTLYDSSGRFVFANSAGNRVHVLVKAKAGSGLLNDWAVASFEMRAIP